MSIWLILAYPDVEVVVTVEEPSTDALFSQGLDGVRFSCLLPPVLLDPEALLRLDLASALLASILSALMV